METKPSNQPPLNKAEKSQTDLPLKEKEEEEHIVLVWSSMPDEAQATDMAKTLIQEQLAACVHLLPPGKSFYRWQGSIQEDSELTLLIKTQQHLYPALEARMQTLHPYEVPEILMTPVTQSLPAYAKWLMEVTQTPSSL